MKVHDKPKERIGEIYVIAVNPSFQGRELGARLAIAGLTHCANIGCNVGMLYVDADNTPARKMYENLGFVTHQQDRAFVGDV